MPPWVNRGWRIAATGFCFAVFGIGGVLVTLVAAPLLWLLVRTPASRKRHAQCIISAACRFFVGVMRHSGVLDYRVSGREHLCYPGTLIVANHPSLIDAIFLIGFMPEVDCVVNRHLWHNPFMGGLIRLAGYISNGAGPELAEACCQSLQSGSRIIIFPEGTRTRPGQPLSFQRGAANVAVHAGANIVPVTIIFRQTTLTKDEPWYHVPSNKVDISITVDQPFIVRDYLENNSSLPLAARALTTDLHDYYTARLAQAGRLPQNESGHQTPSV